MKHMPDFLTTPGLIRHLPDTCTPARQKYGSRRAPAHQRAHFVIEEALKQSMRDRYTGSFASSSQGIRSRAKARVTRT